MRKLLINSDHDRTLSSDFSSTVAIRFNSSINAKKALSRLLSEPHLGGPLLPGPVVEDYGAHGRLETLGDIARCGEWGFYEDGRVSKRALIAIKSILLEGLSESDLAHAISYMKDMLQKGAAEYCKGIRDDGHFHIILSDGWYPLVKATAEALSDSGAFFHAIEANHPVFVNGRFSGRLEKIDKLEAATRLFCSLGFFPDARGIFPNTVMVDDSQENIPIMGFHELPIAFSPTCKGAAEFNKKGIEISHDLNAALKRIRDFAARP